MAVAIVNCPLETPRIVVLLFLFEAVLELFVSASKSDVHCIENRQHMIIMQIVYNIYINDICVYIYIVYIV